jgi:hypothetical protein
MRRARSILVALGLIGAPAGAGASEAPRTSSLGWVRMPGAEACIGARELALAVELRLGRAALVSPAQAELFIEARVEPAPPGFRARITLSDVRGAVLGTRDLESPDPACRALDEQLALVIALLLDPDAALGPRPPVAPPPPPQVVIERVAVPVVAPAPPAREPWRESISLGPALVAGLLPKIGVAAFLRGEIVPPRFVPIELGGAVWLNAQADASTAASKGATLSLAYGMLGLCPLVYRTELTTVRGCAEVAVGALRAVGHGFTSSNAAGQEQPVAMGSLAGRVSRRLIGPLEIGVGLGLVVPFTRPRFFYVDAAKNQQELFRIAPVAGVVDASVGLAFP